VQQFTLGDEPAVDDGLVGVWQPDDPQAPGWQRVRLGLWRGRAAPGADTVSAPSPQVAVQGAWGVWQAEVWAQRWSPRERTQPSVEAATTHHHDTPAGCSDLHGLTCYSGRTDAVGAMAVHPTPWSGGRARLGALWWRDRGTLTALLGQGQLSARLHGGWIDLDQRLAPDWTLRLRWERVVLRQDLTGVDAAAAALAAGLGAPVPAQRLGLGVDRALGAHGRVALDVAVHRPGRPQVRLAWQVDWEGEGRP